DANNSNAAVSESVLLQRYFDKDHAFRQGSDSQSAPAKALIDDQNGIGFGASEAWGGLSSLLGPQNVVSAGWNSTLHVSSDPDDRYLWAYAGGPGSIADGSGTFPRGTSSLSSGNVVESTQYAGDAEYHAVFNMLFGS